MIIMFENILKEREKYLEGKYVHIFNFTFGKKISKDSVNRVTASHQTFD